MAKRVSRQPAVGLFGEFVPVARVPAIPIPEPVSLSGSGSFSPDQLARQRLAAASLQRDITRFQQQLDSPLASWEQKDHQVIEANVALSFTLKSLAEFLPADLQPLIAQFIDLRAQLVLREFLDSDDLP